MYKRIVLLSVLNDLYPGIPIACGTTYESISFHNIGGSIPCVLDDAFTQRLKDHTLSLLAPEATIQAKYDEFTLAHNLTILRTERDILLKASDIYALSDFPHSSDIVKQSWIDYRQALRDITNTYPAPATDDDDLLIGIVWPVKP